MGSILHAVTHLDISIYYFLSRFAGNRVLCRLVRLEESDNFLKGAIFFAIFWRLWFRTDKLQPRRRRDICAVLTGSILAIIAARALAFMVPFRVRPMDNPALVHPVYALVFGYNLEHWSGFPSDTAAYFFALAAGIAWLSRHAAIPILLYTAVWICLTRMFVGVHYASDIFVGAATGTAVVLLSLRSKFVDRSVAQPLVAMANRKSGWFYFVAFLISFEMATVFEGSRTLGNAVFHAVAAALHLRPLGVSDENRPLETWGGLVGTALFVALISYVLVRMFRKLPGTHRPASSSPPTILSAISKAAKASENPAALEQNSMPDEEEAEVPEHAHH
jgi:undecaprenyl-diphosphatase